jgi:hypothetical protein
LKKLKAEDVPGHRSIEIHKRSIILEAQQQQLSERCLWLQPTGLDYKKVAKQQWI